MANKLDFYLDGNEGYFSYDEKIYVEFCAFLESIEHQYPNVGELALNKVMNHCSLLATKNPYFLDAYAHAAGALFENGDIDEASIWYERGLEQAYKAIPSKFNGIIPWGFLSNRPFLRLHSGLILCLAESSSGLEVEKACEKHLKWNPNDNLGMRFILADAYVFNKRDSKKVRAFIEEDFNHYPPAHYNMALLHFRKREYIEAITQLRLGLFDNPYIAELIFDNSFSRTHEVTAFNSYAGPETAWQYASGLAGYSWTVEEDALLFLDWVSKLSYSMFERARLAELNETLNATYNPSERGVIISNIEELRKSITVNSSERISLYRRDRIGHEQLAWEFMVI